MVYTIIATLKIKRGKFDEALSVIRNFSKWIKENETGTICYSVHKLRGQNTLVVYEQYKDIAAFNAHSDHFKERAGILPSLVEGEIQVQNLEDI